MLIKQQKVNLNKKYSDIKDGETSYVSTAEEALSRLLKNGYALMTAYHINEIVKLIRALRELDKEYTMKTIENKTNLGHLGMFYEFTLNGFIDDRNLAEIHKNGLVINADVIKSYSNPNDLAETILKELKKINKFNATK